MKMNKTISMLTMMLLIGASTGSVFADTNKADTLNKLGMLNGTEKGYELERQLTRTEASVMLSRVLGIESHIKQVNHTSVKFKDVPAWATSYVKELNNRGLINGKSDTSFGADDSITAQEYMTLMLRTLGYSDKLGQFTWDKAVQYGAERGILSSELTVKLLEEEFTRELMVEVTHSVLQGNVERDTHTLIEELIKNGSISEEVAKTSGILQGVGVNLSELEIKQGEVYDNSVLTSAIEYKNILYVRGNDGIYKINKENNKEERILSNTNTVVIKDDMIVFTKNGESGLFYSDLNGKNVITIDNGDYINTALVDGKDVYYTSEDGTVGLYKYNTITKQKEKVAENLYEKTALSKIDGGILFTSFNRKANIYRENGIQETGIDMDKTLVLGDVVLYTRGSSLYVTDLVNNQMVIEGTRPLNMFILDGKIYMTEYLSDSEGNTIDNIRGLKIYDIQTRELKAVDSFKGIMYYKSSNNTEVTRYNNKTEVKFNDGKVIDIK